MYDTDSVPRHVDSVPSVSKRRSTVTMPWHLFCREGAAPPNSLRRTGVHSAACAAKWCGGFPVLRSDQTDGSKVRYVGLSTSSRTNVTISDAEHVR
jgi:hypothetical protein